MAGLADASIDAIVTDPPYELGFMGKKWDSSGIAYEPVVWSNALRVLKPGGYVLAFGGMRTHHRMVVAIEDAGFEIRDSLVWLFGSGFPKSLNASAALRGSLHADVLCACGLRSTKTVPDSLDDYPSSHDFDDGRPRPDEGSGLSAPPSLDGARGRSRSGQHSGDLAATRSNTSPGAVGDHLSSAGFPRQHEASDDCQSADSAQRGTPLSTSNVGSTVGRKTGPSTQGKSHWDDDSAASSLLLQYEGNAHLSQCSECGGVVVADGFGTALKPAVEYICMARRPLIGTITDNYHRLAIQVI